MPSLIEHIDFHGQPALHLVTAAGARAIVSLHGAQVLSWIPPGGEERLYLSPLARFDGSAAIRGGVPVCFPQFAELGPLPRHGFARTISWSLTAERSGKDFALVTLTLSDSDATRALWPYPFWAELGILIEDSRLDLELEVENTGSEALEFTAALHTYLAVREVEQSRLEGLHGYTYHDQVDAGRTRRDSGDVLLIEAETDRIYHDVKRPLLLREYDRSLGVNADGFSDVVVWNPWVERSATIADLPADGFRRMLCVEAAAAHRPVRVDAGESWWGRQTLVAL
ncbi:D-hexose-6-phosphate mutarotase [Thauera chlorobenzoica]|uniref:Putative glucose-6-phosphate 1-epimerase n=1 Tax=Thauera chlorobenzoica TaxID=96773 RepID=A0A1H5V2E6_9RHOO|nr:D-hexose-6-phosphate mutarotase [Thauera chlorobenzoica]APR05465.1 Aldose 1-epimerase [Thauera chlorobenzoica]SEF81346.1 glucose-6-phosphate 1-epimerase [Thauera chlorobenzoica]